MAVSYRFDIVDGPRSGDKIALKSGVKLLIGRTKQGIDLLDPRVSTRHAELSWDNGRLWVQDLNSATGTMVDGVAIGPDPVPLADGHRLLIGDSVLQYVESSRLLPQWVYWLALAVLLGSAPAFILQVIEVGTPWSSLHPQMAAPASVIGHDGLPVHPQGLTKSVPVDRCFLRETLPHGGASVIREVTDHDGDQVSEIWVTGPGWQRIYTFSATGAWELLGELPPGCSFTDGPGNRPLTCDIRKYDFQNGIPFTPGEERCARGSNKGHYQLRSRRNALGGSLDGVFVWLKNNESGGPAGAPRPYAVGVRGLENLGGWLYERQINEPVHFVVCEEMLRGMGAYALTSSGRIVRLDPGCGYSLEVQGNASETETKGELPVAIAFTETGRQLLGEQVSVFLGGSELHHFQSPQQRAWADLVSSAPLHRTADYLTIPEPDVARRTALPREDPSLMVTDGRLWGISVPGKLRADTWVWTSPSKVLRTPCGAIVQVDTNPPLCTRPCFTGSTFMTISVPNHGGRFTVPYADQRGARFITPDGEVEVSVDVFTPSGLLTQVVGASVAARDTKMCNVPQEDGPLRVGPAE